MYVYTVQYMNFEFWILKIVACNYCDDYTYLFYHYVHHHTGFLNETMKIWLKGWVQLHFKRIHTKNGIHLLEITAILLGAPPLSGGNWVIIHWHVQVWYVSFTFYFKKNDGGKMSPVDLK